MIRLIRLFYSVVLFWSVPGLFADSAGYEVLWQKSFGGAKDDAAYAVAPTKEDGVIVAGACRSFGAGKDDMCVVRFDAHGRVQWEKTFGKKRRDFANAIARTDDGNYLVAGTSRSYSEGGDYDLFLVKITPEGKKIWMRDIGGKEKDYATAVAATPDGGAIVAGATRSFGRGSYDFFVVRLDQNGKILWSKTYGGKHAEKARAIVPVSDGYIVAGGTETYGKGDSDFYMIKIDRHGNKKWERTYGGKKYDMLEGLCVTRSGEIVAVGTTRSYKARKKGLFVMKTDDHGDAKWQKLFDFKEHDYARAVACREGEIFVVGATKSLGHGRADFYLLELDGAGRLEWADLIGGKKYDIAHAIAPVKNGYVIAGESESFGDDDNDFFVVRLKRVSKREKR